MKWFLFFIIFFQGILMADIKYIDFNGKKIPVIFERDTSLPTFNLQLVFTNAGYIKDGKTPGLANIASSIYNEGTAELGSVGFAKLLEDKAINLSVQNGFETFSFEVASLKDYQKYSISLLSRLLFSPNFSTKTLSKTKMMINGKLKRKENDYDYLASNGLNELMYAKTPLQFSKLGNEKTISKITLADVRKFTKQNLTLQNLIVVCGGDVEFEEFAEQFKDVLRNIEDGAPASKLDYFEVSKEQKSESITKPTEQAYIYFGSPFFMKTDDSEQHLAKVASFILGGSGFGSRLTEEVRVKRGLAYSAYSFISINKTNTNMNGYLQTKLTSADEAVKLVREIIAEFVKNGVTQKELDGAIAFISGSEPLRVETLSQRLGRSFSLHYRGLPQDYQETELAKIEKISLDELNNFIKKHNEIELLSFFVVKK